MKSTSRLVVLDVVVTDKKGNLVTNLKREDFTVTESKETQTLLNFEAPGAHAVMPEVDKSGSPAGGSGRGVGGEEHDGV